MSELPPTADGFYPIGIPIEVCDKFEELALMLKREKHFRRYSSDAILHQIRWHFRVERSLHAFKCNDHWTAPLARWFLSKHPEMSGFFELREKRPETVDHEQ